MEHGCVDLAVPITRSGTFAMTYLRLPSQGRIRVDRHSQVLRSFVTALPDQRPIPNNVGPTLLLALGLPLVPLLIGVPLVLWGLSRIRDAQGELALPWLSKRLPDLVGWNRPSS